MVDALGYILVGIAAAAVAGPICVESLRRGLKGGFMPAFLVNIGASLVDAIYLLVIFFGLAPFLSGFHLALGLFGAAVLVFLGLQSIREFFAKKSPRSAPSASESKDSFVAGILINIASPALLVWLAFYGVVSSSLGGEPNEAVLFSLFMVVLGTIIWGAIFSYLAHLGKKVMNEKAMRYVSLAAGILLIGFGLYFGYSAL